MLFTEAQKGRDFSTSSSKCCTGGGFHRGFLRTALQHLQAILCPESSEVPATGGVQEEGDGKTSVVLLGGSRMQF